jgi:hypothetical protein
MKGQSARYGRLQTTIDRDQEIGIPLQKAPGKSVDCSRKTLGIGLVVAELHPLDAGFDGGEDPFSPARLGEAIRD